MPHPRKPKTGLEAAKPATSAPSARPGTKSATLLGLLKSKRGATLAEMMDATGWQAHSVRGFLAGSLRKRHGLMAKSECRDGENRRYRIA
ncbi:MAG: DUF3489 domain-containing protein [Hyphomicrobium sp.]